MDHSQHSGPNEKSDLNLAFSSTTHCLAGCGLGEVFGIVVGTALELSFFSSLGVGIVAGFVFGYLLGIRPLLGASISLLAATKIVLATETLSIVVMETAEALTEIYFPGLMGAGLSDLVFWLGLATALLVGFVAAFPVNLFLVKKGIRHSH